MRNILLLLGMLSAYFFTGCSSLPSVYSDKLQGVDFNSFKTYAILPVSDTTSSSVYHNAIMEQNLATAIQQEMQNRGYVLDNSNPDILINLTLRMRDVDTVVVEPLPLAATYPYYSNGYRMPYERPYYYSGYSTLGTVHGAQLRDVEYTEGMMIIDVIRNSDDNLIWRGWSDRATTAPTVSSEMQELVREIFKEYPGRARVSSGF
ncbi:MAG TPA: DUF4136 domain-containing protein [Patescibacteria group bacterium]|nr:DUF4136 domain-containing protein [Patescibacteria group bacterium]